MMAFRKQFIYEPANKNLVLIVFSGNESPCSYTSYTCMDVDEFSNPNLDLKTRCIRICQHWRIKEALHKCNKYRISWVGMGWSI